MKRYLERVSCNWSQDSVRLLHTAPPAIKQTFFYIQEAGYFKTRPPYFTERENLESFLIVLTLSGQGRLCYDNAEYHLKSGDIFWIDCRLHHYYECLKDSNWEFLWFHFYGGNSYGFFKAFGEHRPPVVTLPQFEQPAKQIRQIIALTQMRDYRSDLKISQQIYQILTHLTLTVQTSRLPHPEIPGYLKSVIKELEQHFQEKLTLDQLAKQFGVSKFYLLKQFKRYAGSTIGEYLITIRINHAKELLKYSDLTVNEIAFSSGIMNVSHFIRIFKTREGKTPLQFRKEWR